jgi:hypothetical protein
MIISYAYKKSAKAKRPMHEKRGERIKPQARCLNFSVGDT